MTITERVANILRVSKEARNSDKELLIIYFQKSGMNLSDEQIKMFRKMPSTETLRRIRQKMQQEGKYPADEIVNEMRFKKYKTMRSEIPFTKTPEQLLEERGYVIVDD